MTIAETARLIAILKMAWPAHQLEAEQGAAVYHRALADIPFDLGERAVDEWLRTGKFFPAPSEIRELALRSGVGLPAAEIAWDEAQRVIRAYRPGDAPPQWSSRVLEETVNSVGWGAIKACDESNIGTLRAQFRDRYNAHVKAIAANDALAALQEAEDRQAMLSFLRRPRPEPTPIAPRKPMALPAAPVRALEPGEEPGETYALRKFRLRHAARQPKSGNQAPDSLAILRALPAWNDLSEDYRRRLLEQHGQKEEEA